MCFEQKKTPKGPFICFSYTESFSLRKLANIAPDILCHTLKIAPTSVANGFSAKLVAANVTANPLFCIPTSIANAVVLSYFNLRNLPTLKPKSKPRIITGGFC